MNEFLTLTLIIWAYKKVGGSNGLQKKINIEAKILPPKQQLSYQGDQVLTSIMSKTSLGPSAEPTGLLKQTL